MKPKGYFSLLLPESLGGAQMNYPDYIALIYSVAQIDGSTAWCMNQGSVLASQARFVDQPFAGRIWKNAGIVLANGPPTNGHSVEKDDFFELHGTWGFSSGIAHADWLVGAARTTMADGSKGFFWHLIPKTDAVIHNNWQVAGLRATGSYQFSVTDYRVPREHVFAYRVRSEDDPLYQISINLLFAGGFAAVALGVARAALDYATRRASSKRKWLASGEIALDQAAQNTIGRAEATWHAAYSFLLNSVNDIWAAVNLTGSAPDAARYQLRLAATHAIRQSRDVADLAYDLCSTDSIFSQAPIHRYFQDMHVISQHLQGRPEIYSLVGQYKLGLPAASILMD